VALRDVIYLASENIATSWATIGYVFFHIADFPKVRFTFGKFRYNQLPESKTNFREVQY
jgi:hypothetical protein